jgi:hypothetical protein
LQDSQVAVAPQVVGAAQVAVTAQAAGHCPKSGLLIDNASVINPNRYVLMAIFSFRNLGIFGPGG